MTTYSWNIFSRLILVVYSPVAVFGGNWDEILDFLMGGGGDCKCTLDSALVYICSTCCFGCNTAQLRFKLLFDLRHNSLYPTFKTKYLLIILRRLCNCPFRPTLFPFNCQLHFPIYQSLKRISFEIALVLYFLYF